MAEIKSGTFDLDFDKIIRSKVTDITEPIPGRPDKVHISKDDVEGCMCGYGHRPLKCRITFDRPFSQPPCAEVALAGMDISRDANARLKLSVASVDEYELKIEVCTWADTRIHGLRITYVAHVTD